jgi:hypothetical protein
VQLVSGDLNDRTQLQPALAEANQSAAGPIWGVFVALAFPGLGVSGAGEEAQGKVRIQVQHQPRATNLFITLKNVASIAAEFGIQCYIYPSATKHPPGQQHSPAHGSDRDAKASIEKHIQSLDLPWT